LEFSKIDLAALEWVKYQLTGPKFIHMVDSIFLRNFCRIIISRNSHNWFHFRFLAKTRGAISPQPLGISTSNLQDM